jgi:hypothetical protein
MGTNYYAQVDFCECCKRPAEELHIGKSSGGWAFLFMPHPERGLTTWAAWKAYLATVPIKNEYGDDVSFEGLSDIVESKQGQWTHQTCPDDAWGPYPRTGSMDPDGYQFSDGREFT